MIDAGPGFLELLGYALPEVVGKHRRIFDDPSDPTPASAIHPDELPLEGVDACGRRLQNGGRRIWVRSWIVPARDGGRADGGLGDLDGHHHRKLAELERDGRMPAIDRAMAVIGFDLLGTTLSANRNFLTLMGYELDDIVGRYHGMFCDPQ